MARARQSRKQSSRLSEQVAKTVRERKDRAEDHYTRGVEKLAEQLYGQTWYHMINAVALDPDHTKAQDRRNWP